MVEPPFLHAATGIWAESSAQGTDFKLRRVLSAMETTADCFQQNQPKAAWGGRVTESVMREHRQAPCLMPARATSLG